MLAFYIQRSIISYRMKQNYLSPIKENAFYDQLVNLAKKGATLTARQLITRSNGGLFKTLANALQDRFTLVAGLAQLDTRLPRLGLVQTGKLSYKELTLVRLTPNTVRDMATE